jgi:hypothetical protein
MIEKCGIGGINNMENIVNRCGYCGKTFGTVDNLKVHQFCCYEGLKYEGLKPDNVKPNHYNKGKKDLIEMWYQTMPLEQFRGTMKSNIIKYTMRYENKNKLEDLNKAMEYLERLKKYEEKELNRN